MANATKSEKKMLQINVYYVIFCIISDFIEVLKNLSKFFLDGSLSHVFTEV